MEKLVFFVDDDKMILNLLEYTLNNRPGYTIKTFDSGVDCLSNMFLKPDVIVLDYIFKGQKMTGLDILKEIRNNDKDIPVIILTSQDDNDVKDEFQRFGANYFIPKNDFFVDALMEKIDAEIQ